ncbi:MAG: PHP domain-containing protein, partial [Pseudonocardiaceae bacterium]
MGWNNPPVRWVDLERALSGRPGGPPLEQSGAGESRAGHRDERHPGDGGDSPAWTRRRNPYEPPPLSAQAQFAQTRSAETQLRTPYAELHCHSNFSFLDGASHPEELVEEAVRLGLDAAAITDHDGMYGVVRFAEAARALGIKTIFGAELSLGMTAPQNGVPDPEGEHLLVLARNPEGYRRLSRVISDAQLRGCEKGKPVYDLSTVAAAAGGYWVVLTGCRKGAVRRALERAGPAAAAVELRRLTELFGAQHVVVELTVHGVADDTERNDQLAALAAAAGLDTVATTAAHYATPSRHRLATALAAVRARRSLDEMDGWLPAAGTAHLRS